MYTENNINIVFLMLGDACNFSCRHCIQNEYILEDKKISPKVYKYLEHLANIRPDADDKITIRFWGGEPLIYMDKIKQVVQVLKDKFEYVIISNGKLLNQCTVDFINEHNINFVLSNDGINTEKIRNTNMLEDEYFLALFKQINLKSINAVVHAYNQDYYDFWRYLDSKHLDCEASFEDLICNWDMPSDIYSYDLKTYEQTMDMIVHNAYKNLLNCSVNNREYQLIEYTINRIVSLLQSYNEQKDILIDAPSCRQILSVMNLDLDGNIYACHNQGTIIGTVDDEYSNLVKKYILNFGKLHEQTECLSCEFIDVCRGGCPFSLPSDGKTFCCERKKIYFKACYKFIELLNFEKVEFDKEDA